YSLALLTECVGVVTGFPFGSYEFSALLGPKWFGLVPATIPLSWFNIGMGSFLLAKTFFPQRRIAYLMISALLILTWDLSIEPIMGHLYPFWIWHDGGGYYGVPLSNFIAWLLIAFVISAILDRFQTISQIRLDRRWILSFYFAHAALSIGLCFV